MTCSSEPLFPHLHSGVSKWDVGFWKDQVRSRTLTQKRGSWNVGSLLISPDMKPSVRTQEDHLRKVSRHRQNDSLFLLIVLKLKQYTPRNSVNERNGAQRDLVTCLRSHRKWVVVWTYHWRVSDYKCLYVPLVLMEAGLPIMSQWFRLMWSTRVSGNLLRGALCLGCFKIREVAFNRFGCAGNIQHLEKKKEEENTAIMLDGAIRSY